MKKIILCIILPIIGFASNYKKLNRDIFEIRNSVKRHLSDIDRSKIEYIENSEFKRTSDPNSSDLVALRFQLNQGFMLVSHNRLIVARDNAKLALEMAYANSKRSIYLNVIDKLNHVTLSYPKSGYDFKGCTDRVLAFVRTNNLKEIFICDLGMKDLTPAQMTQNLIHEAAHTAGVFNECNATLVEVGALIDAELPIQFLNGYMKECGFLD